MPAGELLNEAMKAAEKIASFSLPAVAMAKEAVNRAFERLLRKVSALRGALSMLFLPPKTRRKAWLPLPKSAPHNSRTVSAASGYGCNPKGETVFIYVEAAAERLP